MKNSALVRCILNTLLYIIANILTDTFIHIFWNLTFTLSLIQCQRLEILPTLGWYIPLSPAEEGKLCQTYWGLPAKSRGETHYGLWEERSFKTQDSSVDLLRISQPHESMVVWLPKSFTVKNRYHDFITKLEAAATCTAHTSAIQLFSLWISCLLTWFQAVSTQHNTVNFSGWLENIPLKYVNKRDLQELRWRLSYKCLCSGTI